MKCPESTTIDGIMCTGPERRTNDARHYGPGRAAVLRILGVAALLATFLSPVARGQDTSRGVDFRPASAVPPGNFSGAELPQFILVTFDDGITSFAESFIQPVIEGLVNPDSSPVHVTYFVTKANTDSVLARERYLAGNELANHTATHTTNAGTTVAQWQWELTEQNRFLVNTVGVPSKEIAGFRAPDLLTNGALWRVLERLGFTYDASLAEQLTDPPGVSRGLDSLVWPYTLQEGAKSACLAQACPDTSLPGLWSIPLWDFYDSTGQDLGSMDAAVGYDSVFSAALEYLFKARYYGNRCPLGLYFHAGQLWSPSRQAIIRSFLQEKLKIPDVWMITMRGLIEWMRNPVPVSGLSQWFADGKERGAGRIPFAPPRATSPVSPPDSALFQELPVKLVWDVSLNADDYEVQIASDSGFSDVEIDTVGCIKATTTVTDSLRAGRSWWRVRPRNGRGFGPWSVPLSFTVDQVSSVGGTQQSLPLQASLEQNFPNPFNPSTEITIHLPRAEHVKLEIYDLLGRHVATLVDENLPGGIFRATWDARGVSSGAYLCRLETSGSRSIQSRKILLLR
jgi:hypothetical protein